MADLNKKILLAMLILVLPIEAIAGSGPRDEGWDSIVPGDNPMTAEQAASTMGAIYASWNLKNCSVRPDIDVKPLHIDIRAGGNEPKDFAKNGKYFEIVRTEAMYHRDVQLKIESIFGEMDDPCHTHRIVHYLKK